MIGIIAAEEIMLKFTDVLRKTTRREDIIARFDNNQFMVAFNRMNIKLYDKKSPIKQQIFQFILNSKNSFLIYLSKRITLSLKNK